MKVSSVVKVWNTEAGFKAAVILARGEHHCGYVGVPKDHPLFELHYDTNTQYLAELSPEEEIGQRGLLTVICGAERMQSPLMVFDVHGSLTWSDFIGKKAEQGSWNKELDDGLWYFGYDCAHSGDGKFPSFDDEGNVIHDPYLWDQSPPKSLDFCIQQCESLAQQIKDKTLPLLALEHKPGMKFLTQEQFTEMWKLQDSLNTATSGSDWKEKNQNWNLAIKSEVMEFFDYIGWKWWKEPSKVKKPSDMQARLELVDIWHFTLSRLMECHDPVEELFLAVVGTCEWHKLPPAAYVKAHVQMLDTEEPMNCKIDRFCTALQFCEWSWDELYKAYIGKVALNNFRQANGYKEGTYQKIWEPAHTDKDSASEPKEDNYFLEQILTQLSLTEGALTYKAVYAKLGIKYMLRTNN